jgi:hypothetical protein
MQIVPMASRLQLQSANAMVRREAEATAHEKRADLVMTIDAACRLLASLKDQGANKAILSDIGALLKDEFGDIEHRINKALDEQGLCEGEPVEMAEFDAVLAEVA